MNNLAPTLDTDRIVRLLKCRQGARVPTLGSDGAAGYDLYAAGEGPIEIWPQAKATLVPTGIKLDMNYNCDMAALIMPRSGLGHKQGLVLGNTIGLIDSDYQGELFVSAWNRNNPGFTHGDQTPEGPIVIHPGDRIAQLVFVPIIHPTLVGVLDFNPELSPDDHTFEKATTRGAGGFGSTGVQG